MAGAHGHSVDDYLEVIYFLAFPIGEYRPAGESAIAARVAEMLGVSRASAGEMLKRLEDEGDGILREGLASLFRDDRIDPLVVIRWKDVYDRLEGALDSCETAANTIANIVVKNA